MNENPHLYLVAGEASGDLLGSKLMMALKKKHSQLNFSGLGGAKMSAQGITPLFNYRELSLMGFAEILPHIRKLKQRMQQVADDIIAKQPDIVITLNHRVFTSGLGKNCASPVRPKTPNSYIM